MVCCTEWNLPLCKSWGRLINLKLSSTLTPHDFRLSLGWAAFQPHPAQRGVVKIGKVEKDDSSDDDENVGGGGDDESDEEA